MEPESDAQQIETFLKKLGTDRDLLSKWVSSNPASAFPNQGLSDDAQKLLLDGDIKTIREKLKNLSADEGGSHRWIVVWVV